MIPPPPPPSPILQVIQGYGKYPFICNLDCKVKIQIMSSLRDREAVILLKVRNGLQ